MTGGNFRWWRRKWIEDESIQKGNEAGKLADGEDFYCEKLTKQRILLVFAVKLQNKEEIYNYF